MSLETETNENVHNSDHLISVYNEAYDTFYKQSGQMNSDRAHDFALAAVFISNSEKENTND